MPMPSIEIKFRELAASFIKRGERGIIFTILKDTLPEGVKNPVTLRSNEDIPKGLTDFNTKQLKLALIGYQNPPKKVIAYFIKSETADTAADYSEAIEYAKTLRFTYMFIPTVETDKKTDDIVSFVKTQRTNNHLIKAVLPNAKADTEGVVNYTTASVTDDDGNTYTAEQYCGRIAGILAGTPMSISATYAPLNELVDCTHLSNEDMDKAVDAGEFIVWWDGDKVKTGRAVNSLVTTTQEKNTQFQKIKIVEAMDMIADDIRMTAEDKYIGKYANSYANKCLLLSAILTYLEGLEDDSVLSSYDVHIDTHANELYLKGRGTDTTDMTDDDLKKANTGSYVYLTGSLGILDAMEDIILPISI